MKGTRPLDNAEIIAVSKAFDGKFEDRNRSLFMLGVSIGGRINELLSLKVSDVWQNDKPVSDVLFSKHIVKGGETSRAVPLNADGRAAIEQVILYHQDEFGDVVEYDAPLFISRVKKFDGSPKRMTTQAGSDALMKAFTAAGLNGKLGTHSMRKSFAQRLYAQTHDIFVVQEMLGHKNVATTQKYLGVNYAEVRQALEFMSVSVGGREPIKYMPLHQASINDLIAEMSKRGYTVNVHSIKEVKS